MFDQWTVTRGEKVACGLFLQY